MLKAVDGEPLVTTGGLKGHTSVERQTWEGGFRLEGDNPVNSTTTVTWSFAPFVRNMDEDTDTVVSGCCTLTRTADVETWLYGVDFAAEPEVWLSSGLALVGRAGLGIYGYDADGKFVSSASLDPDTFAARVSDDESGVGFRGQLGIGMKFACRHHQPRGLRGGGLFLRRRHRAHAQQPAVERRRGSRRNRGFLGAEERSSPKYRLRPP